jgi:hypothetical protein
MSLCTIPFSSNITEWFNVGDPVLYAPIILSSIIVVPGLIVLGLIFVYHAIYFSIAVVLKIFCVEPIASNMFEMEYTISDMAKSCVAACSCKPCLIRLAACINRSYPDSVKPNSVVNEEDSLIASAPSYYASV